MQIHRLEALAREHVPRAPSERLLLAVADCAVLLARAARWQDVIGAVLARFGEAADIDRISVYRVRRDPQRAATTSMAAHWAAPGKARAGSDDFYQRMTIPQDNTFMASILDQVERGEPVSIQFSESPEEIRTMFERRGMRSAMLLPINVDQQYWGFCIMGQTDYERHCEDHEISTKLAFTASLGAAIGRGAHSVHLG